MPTDSHTPVLQYLRLSAKKSASFGPYLALAVHRQSTSPGFIASLEGEIMAEAHAWVALILWQNAAEADRSTEELFHSDYFAEFANQVERVEANRLFTASADALEKIRDSRYAKFAWIETLEPAPSFSWPAFVARQQTLFHASQGFEAAFSFSPLKEMPQSGLVSTWGDSRALRAAAALIQDQRPSPEERSGSSEYFRITSSNPA